MADRRDRGRTDGGGEQSPLGSVPPASPAALGEALAWLDRHVNLEAIEAGRAGRLGLPTLERVEAMLSALGDPQLAYPVVHVTGTNGKGSTTRMAASLLAAQGLAVGTYTSPHLERINERMTYGPAEIDDQQLATMLHTVEHIEHFLGIRATWFELVTTAAYLWFADRAVDAAVVEVGLGGRFDATNVARSEVAVVTNVDLDHTEILGSTRAAIADEKAGIIKEHSVAVLGVEDPAIAAVFDAEAERAGAAAVWRRGIDFGCSADRLAVGGRVVDLWTPLGSYYEVFVPLHGAHQAANAACALAAAQALLGTPLHEEVVATGFAAARVPGRLEVVGRSPTVLLDGAHNAAGAEALAAALAEDFAAARRIVVVLGCLRGRRASDLLGPLDRGRVAAVVACRPPSPRAQDPAEVVEEAAALGFAAEDGGSPAEALERALELAAEDDLVLVTGSLYVVGAVRAELA